MQCPQRSPVSWVVFLPSEKKTHHNNSDNVLHDVLDIGADQECYKEREDARSI